MMRTNINKKNIFLKTNVTFNSIFFYYYFNILWLNKEYFIIEKL